MWSKHALVIVTLATFCFENVPRECKSDIKKSKLIRCFYTNFSRFFLLQHYYKIQTDLLFSTILNPWMHCIILNQSISFGYFRVPQPELREQGHNQKHFYKVA